MGNRQCVPCSGRPLGLIQNKFLTLGNRMKYTASISTPKLNKTSKPFNINLDDSLESDTLDLFVEEPQHSPMISDCNFNDDNSYGFSMIPNHSVEGFSLDTIEALQGRFDFTITRMPPDYFVSQLHETCGETSIIFNTYPCQPQYDCGQVEQMLEGEDKEWRGFGVDLDAFDYRHFITRRNRTFHEMACT